MTVTIGWSYCRRTALIALVLTGSVSAQSVLWSSHYGGVYNEGGYAVAPKADGSYFACGSTYSYGWGDFDVYLLKFNNNGDTLWWRTYGGTKADVGHDVVALADGGCILVGSTFSYGNGKDDIYVLRVDSAGQAMWSRSFGGAESEEGWTIRPCEDGGYIVGGSTASSGAGYGDMYLLRLSDNGDSLWAKTFGGAGGEFGYAARQTPDSGFVIVGVTGSFGEGYSSLYAARTNKNGDSLWATTFGGSKADYGQSVEIAADGGILLLGGTASFGLGYYDMYLVRLAPDGQFEWERTYGGAKEDRAYSLCAMRDGGNLIAGTTESFGSGGTDVYYVRTDPDGNQLWWRTLGGSQNDYCRMISKAGSGQILVAGYTYSYSAGGSDLYLAALQGDDATPVEIDDPWHLPDGFALEQNYPNPFNLTTTIQFSLPQRVSVTVKVFNVLGQMVWQKDLEQVSAGVHSVEWDGRLPLGGIAASGIYFYQINAGDRTLSRKMAVVK